MKSVRYVIALLFPLSLPALSFGNDRTVKTEKVSAILSLTDEGFGKLKEVGKTDTKTLALYSAVQNCKMPGDLPCARVYTNLSSETYLTELCTKAGIYEPGIYLKRGSEIRHYGWFDETHFKFACAEECNKSEGGCSYEITPQKTADIERIKYLFNINLTRGEYELSIKRHKITVLKKKVLEGPS